MNIVKLLLTYISYRPGTSHIQGLRLPVGGVTANPLHAVGGESDEGEAESAEWGEDDDDGEEKDDK